MTAVAAKPAPYTSSGICPAGNLIRGESLVIDSLRHYLKDKRCLWRIAHTYHSELGPAIGKPAFEAFLGVFDLLNNNARRRVMIHYPLSEKVSADERLILTLVSAAQHGRHEHVAAMVGWLFPKPAQGSAVIKVLCLAEKLKAGGIILSAPRQPALAKSPEVPEPRAVG